MISKPETNNGVPAFYAKTVKDWRGWLKKNGQKEKLVCLIIYHEKSKTPGVRINEAMENALCYGWIDSKANKRDVESFYLAFTPRKPKSNWSKVNRERAEKMIKKGFMAPEGQATIDLAKKTGTWDKLADADNELVPDDLQKLFNQNKTAFAHFQKFPPSSKRLILGWIINAKRPETRQKRIEQTVALAADNIRANHPK
jgi:uncharacterized protein YdeI (YjbR/CyaY-like superfamily)